MSRCPAGDTENVVQAALYGASPGSSEAYAMARIRRVGKDEQYRADINGGPLDLTAAVSNPADPTNHASTRSEVKPNEFLRITTCVRGPDTKVSGFARWGLTYISASSVPLSLATALELCPLPGHVLTYDVAINDLSDGYFDPDLFDDPDGQEDAAQLTREGLKPRVPKNTWLRWRVTVDEQGSVTSEMRGVSLTRRGLAGQHSERIRPQDFAPLVRNRATVGVRLRKKTFDFLVSGPSGKQIPLQVMTCLRYAASKQARKRAGVRSK